jgi:hypothetical protein
MKICIIDNKNEDIGLKILFPEADYYVCNELANEYRKDSYNYYNFTPILNLENINDKNYNILFVVMPLRHIINDEIVVRDIRTNYETKIKIIIDNNSFEHIFFFDNEDYDVDPNLYVKNTLEKNILFFKRNYDKKTIYPNNVKPFPFIMIGTKCIIERCDRFIVPKDIYLNHTNRSNIVFFSGGLYCHDDKIFNVYVDRIGLYNKIKHTIFNPGYLNNEEFNSILKNSRFSLDLPGGGNPNMRTFEILVSGSLMLQKKNDLVWPFEDKFSEECLFTDENDYLIKLQNLLSNSELYNKCLLNQYNIVNKYFNKEWLRNYILQFIT